MRPALPFSASAALTMVVLAQQPAEKFRITVAGGAITGTEEYRIAKTPQGYQVTGTSHIARPGGSLEVTQHETLGSAWDLVRYRMDAIVAGQPQTIEAWREGDSVRMRVAAGGQTPSHETLLRWPALVLDNLIVSHYQVLLNLFAGRRAAKDTAVFQLFVPQTLAAVTSKMAASGEEDGVLDGRPMRLRKYTLEVAATLVEIWAEAKTNRLMRVSVPLQKVELVRDGFSPAAPPAAAEPAGPPAFVERAVTFPSGALDFPGTLCLPANRAGPVPVVVLVHGSGPHDRDETIGPNTPFRDLAHGLAAAGVATLRYDKRTFAFRSQIDPHTVTVDQEVVEDAVAAVRSARTLPEVDGRRVFVLGHSLGGTLAPLIATRVPPPPLAGLILLAAGARPLDEAIADQTAFQLQAAGQTPETIAQQVQAIRDAFARVRSGAAPDTETVFFAPARYWRDLLSRKPLATLAALPVPVLVLQGGKDVQITKADFDLIRQALAGKPPAVATSRWFPDLNHLFMRVAGAPTGAEYGRAGHVDPQVIETIADWITTR